MKKKRSLSTLTGKSQHSGPPKAIALQWDGTTTPKITAKGEGDIAEQIIALAKAHNIPLQENAGLASVLTQLELGDEIPESLYLAVAQVIAFAYHLSGRTSVLKDQSV